MRFEWTRSSSRLCRPAATRNSNWSDVVVGQFGTLHFAMSTGAAVVTLDAEFHALLVRVSATKPSVIGLRVQGLKGEVLTVLVHAVIESCRDSFVGGPP